MVIRNLNLQDFRSFRKKKINFDEKTTVIVGSNAIGKTNILESVNLLSTGKSFHAGREEEMIRNGQELGRVSGQLTVDSERQDLEIILTRGELNGERVARKKLSVNGVGKMLFNFAGVLKTVLFGPWDLELVSGSPGFRRRFLDTVLSQVDREYRRAILSYEKGIRQRNKLLERIREGEASPSQLLFWNQLVIKNGDYISSRRADLIGFFNDTGSLGNEAINAEYDNSPISEKRFEQYAVQEIASATTLVGPHRDDFIVKTRKRKQKIERNLAIYGSRGEQRMGVLWLKLAELSFVEKHSQTRPVLLLDDIFSELDHEHRDVVISTVGRQQTIITTADPHTVQGWRKIGQFLEL